jgi:hypothetical protein
LSCIFIIFEKNTKLWDVQVVAVEVEHLAVAKITGPVVLVDAIN